MSEAIAFDTHRFVKRLTEHGFTEEQAEALANGQVALPNGNLATKADVKAVRRGIETLRQKTKAGIEAMQRDIEPCGMRPRPASKPCSGASNPCGMRPRPASRLCGKGPEPTSQPSRPTC